MIIAVVFAGLLLPPPNRSRTASKTESGRSPVVCEGLMVWIIATGQTALGLLAAWLWLVPMMDGHPAMGMLIETGFVGGHGTATAMGRVLESERVGIPGGTSLGILMATAGLVYGIISGVVWVNIGIRRGWTRWTSDQIDAQSEAAPDDPTSDDFTSDDPNDIDLDRLDEPAAVTDDPSWHQRHAWRSAFDVDPILITLMHLAVATGIGLAAATAVQRVGAAFEPPVQSVVEKTTSVANQPDDANHPDVAIADDKLADDKRDADKIDDNVADGELRQRTSVAAVLAAFPLFIYTLGGGWLWRRVLTALGLQWSLDGPTITRLISIAMDGLIVAAITSLDIRAVGSRWVECVILIVLGAIWSGVCLVVLARRILPRDRWFELGLINYGMSTGVTATGFVLLRLVDPKIRSGAAEDYALAAPISSPFVGGGMLTFALPIVIMPLVPLGVLAVGYALLVAMLIAATYRYARSGGADEAAGADGAGESDGAAGSARDSS